MTMRLETLMMLADMRNATNHFILKTANALDRILRASGTTARKSATTCVRKRYEDWEEDGEMEELLELAKLEGETRTPAGKKSKWEKNQEASKSESAEKIWEAM